MKAKTTEQAQPPKTMKVGMEAETTDVKDKTAEQARTPTMQKPDTAAESTQDIGV